MTVVEEPNIFWYEGEEPEYWNDAARICVKAIYENELNVPGLAYMRELLDRMIDMAFATQFIVHEDFAEHWRNLGSATIAAMKENTSVDFSQQWVDDTSNLLVRKQKDYGSDAIRRFGRIGILVRTHDKIARLQNLISRGLDPENESLVDNYTDVIGYCSLGMLVETGWFELSMKKEK